MSEATIPFPQLYFCCDERRRDAVRGSALNGIDYLEVVDHDALVEADRQRFLRVHFVNDIVANSLATANVAHQRRRAHPADCDSRSDHRHGRRRRRPHGRGGRAGRFFDLHPVAGSRAERS